MPNDGMKTHRKLFYYWDLLIGMEKSLVNAMLILRSCYDNRKKQRESRQGETPYKTAMQANKRDSVPLAGRLSFL